MKIIIISPAYPYRGGIAHYAGLLFKTLAQRGHNVKIFNFKRLYPKLLFPGKTQFEQVSETEKIETERIIDSINPFNWIITGLKILREKPNVLIFKYWLPFLAPCYGVISAVVKIFSHTKIIFICHNITPHEKFPFSKLLTKFAFAFADHFIVQSNVVENDLIKIKPKANYKKIFHPIYDIFGEEIDKKEARKILGLNPNDKILLFFGYIRAYKGLDLILRAMKFILAQIQVKLLVAGEFYENPEKYFKIVEDEGISDFVIFKSEYIPNDDVKVYFSASDVVVLPYVSATQSGIVQIAYNFNRPVIATNVGGLPEVVFNGETGLITEPEPEKIAEAVVRFFKENLGEKFSKNVKSAKEKFSWENLANAIESIINESGG
ncbi:glycosyltransferase [Candidatus Chrysopegis kryptomonas]|uniref:Glycosyltransferase involved in cell wall bisynthesis n=1 Tax=Candidatus Chryseopegocella kryptomonas TaxID=1633643 RepID=A0A0N7MXG2_9BACT|nr:glycosyltransferase [Candidatus Chrysopegis kryptomonas]CUT01355.1 Glycosyltransferase involved in cell wall bisynthesis [Candidatus Chrysopegis kryptomonas]